MLLSSTFLTAQQSKVVSAINALGYYQKDKTDIESIQKAKGFIDEASQTESTAGKPKTWGIPGFVNIENEIEDKLIEIEINTVHKECQKLKDKYNKLKNDLVNIEWEIFCLSSI